MYQMSVLDKIQMNVCVSVVAGRDSLCVSDPFCMFVCVCDSCKKKEKEARHSGSCL
jgi:hypothetical protein